MKDSQRWQPEEDALLRAYLPARPQRMKPHLAAHGQAPRQGPSIMPRALEKLPKARDQKRLSHAVGAKPGDLAPGEIRQQVEVNRRRGPRPDSQAPRQMVGGFQGETAQADREIVAEEQPPRLRRRRKPRRESTTIF
ncbi:hypothetical protein CASFOL_016856 [Castilleja foliolosa]|uniref:Uncharacterized protein n=1 Tax=Castilleja foliolosa TaxID=1961234 RepID=A0ABD3DCU2_9LAMI